MKRSRLPFLPKLTERLAVRLVLLLTLALLPLGVVAVMTTAQTVADARVSAERAMVGVTAEAVAGKRALIESAFASASTLGPLALERLANPEECTVILSDFVRRSGVFSFVSLIETDGQMRCRSDGQSSSIAGTPQFESLMERPAASVTAQARDLARNEAVMIVTQPIREGVTLRGFILITVQQRSLDLMRRLPVNSGPASSVLFNTDG